MLNIFLKMMQINTEIYLQAEFLAIFSYIYIYIYIHTHVCVCVCVCVCVLIQLFTHFLIFKMHILQKNSYIYLIFIIYVFQTEIFYKINTRKVIQLSQVETQIKRITFLDNFSFSDLWVLCMKKEKKQKYLVSNCNQFIRFLITKVISMLLRVIS